MAEARKNLLNQGGGTAVIPDPLTIGRINVTTLSDVVTINGASYPPPGGNTSQWATFDAVQNVNLSGFSIANVNNISLSTINGAPYVSGSTDQWATYRAVQNVNLSGFSISNISNVTMSGTLTVSGVNIGTTLNSLSAYTYTQIPSISGAITTLSGTVSNLSGYVYTQIPSISSAITSLSGTVSNLSGYVYTQIPSISSAITSLSGTVSNLSGYVYTQIPSISSAITSLSGTVSNLSGYVYTQIPSISSAITTLSGTVSNLSGYVYTQIPSISSAITTLSGTVSNLSGYVYTQIPSISSAITTLSGTVSNLSGYVYTQIPSISGAITSLSSVVYTLSAQFTTLSADVYDLSTQFTTLSADVYDLSTQFTTLSADVYDLSTQFTTLSADVYDLSTQFTTLSADVYDLSTQFTTLSADVYDLSTQFTTLSADVYDLSTQFTTLSADVYDLSLRVDGFAVSFTTENLTVTQSATISGLVVQNDISGFQSLWGREVRISDTQQTFGLGDGALSNSVGVNLLGLGDLAGADMDPLASNVVAIGFAAGQTNSGAYSVFVGSNAGTTNQGSSVIAIGNNAGIGNTQNQVVAIGDTTASNNGGSNLVAIGPGAGETNQGADTIAIGYLAAYGNTGSNTVAIGCNAGSNVTTSIDEDGGQNIFIGAGAGSGSTSSSNTILGINAGQNSTITAGIALGFGAAGGATLDNAGIAIGRGTFSDATAGSIAIGVLAGYQNTGVEAIFIGTNPNTGTGAVNHSDYAFEIYSSNSDPATSFVFGNRSTNQLAIGTKTLSATLTVKGDGLFTEGLVVDSNVAVGGNLAVLGNIVAAGNLAGSNLTITTINGQPYPTVPDPLSVNVLNVSSNATLGDVYIAGTDISGFTTFSSVPAIFQNGSETIAIGNDIQPSSINSVLLGTNAGDVALGWGVRTSIVAIGYRAGCSNATDNVIAIGSNAGGDIANTGSNTIAIGFGNVARSNSGPDLIAFGGGDCAFSNQGTGVFAAGNKAAYQNQGDFVIAIGCNAGRGNTGDRSIFLGSNPNTAITNSADDRFIVYSQGDVPFLYGDSSNKQLGVGTTTVSGALTTSGDVWVDGSLTVTGTVDAVNLTVDNINGNAFYPAFGTNILRVAIDGCDTIAQLPQNRYSYPFSTISQAITSASPGDAINVLAGTYYESNLILSNNISIRGTNVQSTIVSTLTDASYSTFMFQMGSNTRLEDMTITLNTGGNNANQTYSVVTISGSNIQSSKLRTLVMNMNHNSSLGNAAAILVTGDIAQPTRVTSASTIRASTINLNASGVEGNSAYNNCVRMAGNSRFSARDTMFFLYGSNCSGASIIACETVSAGVIDLKSCTVSASGTGTTNTIAEISQTHPSSEIVLGYTNLEYHNANGKGFAMAQTPANIISAAIGAQGKPWTSNFSWNSQWYMVPGTGTVTIGNGTGSNGFLPALAADATPYTIQQTALLHDITLRTNVSLGNSIMYANIYSNVITSPILTLSLTGNSKLARNGFQSFKVNDGDSLYIELSGHFVAPDPGLRSVIVDYGIF